MFGWRPALLWILIGSIFIGGVHDMTALTASIRHKARSIAEVVRDLFRADNQPEQSYSERQLYEAALDRMAREIAAVAKLDERGAVQRITEVLSKSAKGRRAAAEEAAADAGIEAA